MKRFLIYAIDGDKIKYTFAANSILELFEISGTIEAAGLAYTYKELQKVGDCMRNIYTVEVINEAGITLKHEYFSNLAILKNWIKSFCKVSVFVWKNGDFFTSYNL